MVVDVHNFYCISSCVTTIPGAYGRCISIETVMSPVYIEGGSKTQNDFKKSRTKHKEITMRFPCDDQARHGNELNTVLVTINLCYRRIIIQSVHLHSWLYGAFHLLAEHFSMNFEWEFLGKTILFIHVLMQLIMGLWRWQSSCHYLIKIKFTQNNTRPSNILRVHCCAVLWFLMKFKWWQPVKGGRRKYFGEYCRFKTQSYNDIYSIEMISICDECRSCRAQYFQVV